MTNISSLQHHAVRTLIFILATSLAGFASAIGTFDRSFQVNGNVDLEVLTRSGDITVRNGAAGTVSIHAKIHSGNSWLGGDHKAEVQELQNNPPIRQNGNSIRIDYVNINNISIDYEITVPENTAIRAHTGSGNQTVEGLKGNVELESGSGDLKLARLTGEMRFQTGSGNIRGHAYSPVPRGSKRAAVTSKSRKWVQATWTSAPDPATSLSTVSMVDFMPSREVETFAATDRPATCGASAPAQET